MTFPISNNGLNLKLSERAILHYLTCPMLATTTNTSAFYGAPFEKKIMHSSFKKAFGGHLPLKADLKFGLAMCDADQGSPKQNSLARMQGLKHRLHLKGRALKQVYKLSPAGPELKTKPHKVLKNALVRSGLQLLSANWLLQSLKEQLHGKRSSRAVLNNFMRHVTKLILGMPGSCPILGLRLLATGRLGKKKKAMAQQISRSIGKVPLSSLRHRVDYAQSFVSTPYGSVGLKVWICYA